VRSTVSRHPTEGPPQRATARLSVVYRRPA
jgi:hypothetical protein